MIIVNLLDKLKVKIRRFIARFFFTPINLFYKAKLNFEKIKRFPIIILTPGKVGSSSVYRTLKNQLPNQVYHIHYLSPKSIDSSSKHHLKSDRKSLPLHLIVSNLLSDKLSTFIGEVNIITIVREPISREISSFFQNTEFYKNSIESGNLKLDLKKSVEILENSLKKNICKNLENWFDTEIKGNFGIDVFSQPFDHKKNYMIFRNGRYNLLLLKMETMSQVFTVAIQAFLSKDTPIYLKKSNVGENKHYAESYSKIKKEIKLKSHVLETIIYSKYFKHFYSELSDEIKQKWKNNK